MVRPLVKWDNPVLYKKHPAYDFNNKEDDPLELASELAEAMLHYGGLGLSACQIGLPYPVFVLKANPFIACFNPVIVDSTSTTCDEEEGCLTFPGLYMKIKRPDGVKVRYATPDGVVETVTHGGLTGRVFQHEMDHINGKAFFHGKSRFQLEQSLDKARKKYSDKIDYTIGDLVGRSKGSSLYVV